VVTLIFLDVAFVVVDLKKRRERSQKLCQLRHVDEKIDYFGDFVEIRSCDVTQNLKRRPLAKPVFQNIFRLHVEMNLVLEKIFLRQRQALALS
jgi:hypothetical protein